jgi:hypothetical protein
MISIPNIAYQENAELADVLADRTADPLSTGRRAPGASRVWRRPWAIAGAFGALDAFGGGAGVRRYFVQPLQGPNWPHLS